MNLYQIHGIINSTVFLLLLPIGIIIAALRNYIGPEWLKWHVFFQLTSVILLIISGSLVFYANRNHKKQKEISKNRKLHKIIGPTILSLLFLQIFWAYYGKYLVSYNIWLMIHAGFGISILGLGWYQIYLGKNMH